MRLVAMWLATLLSSSLTAQTPAPTRTTAPSADTSIAPSAGATPSVLDSTVGASGASAAHDLTPVRRTPLRSAPDGDAVAMIEPRTLLRVTARERGWLRVRAEGWIREEEVVPADSTVRSALGAADLRADPEGSRGKTVRWEVQVLAFQTADPLRRDLAPDEPYLLARGPGSESALLYLTIPPALLPAARSIAPLSGAIVTARVRTGRSDPAGVPVLDLLSIAHR